MSPTRALRLPAVVFTLLYLVALFLPTLPEGSYSDAHVLALVEDGGDRTAIVVGGYALVGAGLAFLWWVSVARSLLDDGAPLARLLSAAGISYAVMLLVASTAFAGVATGRSIGELPAVEDAFLVRVVSNQGFHLLLVPGLMSAGVCVLAASLLGRRSRVLPVWCATAGLVVAPLCLLGAAWVTQFLVPLWVLAAAFAARQPVTEPVS